MSSNEFGFFTGAEILASLQDRHEQIRRGEVTWGAWQFDPRAIVLVHRDGYEVDVERVRNKDERYAIIMHVTEKRRRFTPEDIGNLVIALQDIRNAGVPADPFK